MFSFHVPAGSTECKQHAIPNYSVSTIFCPGLKTGLPLNVLFWGSHDGVDWGPLVKGGKELSFDVLDHYHIILFDVEDFEGIQYLKVVLSHPLKEDVYFPAHLKNA